MPITQTRMIAVLNAAQNLISRHEKLSREINDFLKELHPLIRRLTSNPDTPPLDSDLTLIQSIPETISGLIKSNSPDYHDVGNIAAETAHFNVRRKSNEKTAELMRESRRQYHEPVNRQFSPPQNENTEETIIDLENSETEETDIDLDILHRELWSMQTRQDEPLTQFEVVQTIVKLFGTKNKINILTAINFLKETNKCKDGKYSDEIEIMPAGLRLKQAKGDQS